MMEDILAIIAVLAGVAFVTLAVRWFLRRSAEKAALEAQERDRQIEQTRKWRESMRAKSLESAVKNTSSVPPRGKETTKKYTPTYSTSNATSTTTTTSSDDGFVNGMLTGMLIDSVVNSITHKSGGSSPIDFPKTESSSSSSWGFDDDDSRKSASSSFSSSDSSSSWSSSSSDSGPSSDW